MGPNDCSVLSSVIITTSSINHVKHDFVDRRWSKPLFCVVDFRRFLIKFRCGGYFLLAGMGPTDFCVIKTFIGNVFDRNHMICLCCFVLIFVASWWNKEISNTSLLQHMNVCSMAKSFLVCVIVSLAVYHATCGRLSWHPFCNTWVTAIWPKFWIGDS